MKIICRFNFCFIDSKKLYTCVIDEASIIEKDHVIKTFKGDHIRGKSHKDVQCVSIEKTTTVNHFPRGLIKHFPNFTHLIVLGGGITEISKTDLNGLEGLVGLYI